jgi:hypothetical protein
MAYKYSKYFSDRFVKDDVWSFEIRDNTLILFKPDIITQVHGRDLIHVFIGNDNFYAKREESSIIFHQKSHMTQGHSTNLIGLKTMLYAKSMLHPSWSEPYMKVCDGCISDVAFRGTQADNDRISAHRPAQRDEFVQQIMALVDQHQRIPN